MLTSNTVSVSTEMLCKLMGGAVNWDNLQDCKHPSCISVCNKAFIMSKVGLIFQDLVVLCYQVDWPV